jgi:outer membrane assembly lipoprotein YfiO
MTMKQCYHVLLMAGLTLFSGSTLLAQYDQEYKPTTTHADDETRPERKHTGFFRHPAKETAATQFEYAKSLSDKGKKSAAMKQYNALVCKWGGSPEAPKAQYEYASLLEETGHQKQAFDEFQYLVDFYVGRFPYEDVLDHQFRIANYFMTTRRARWLFGGFKAPERALPMFEKVVANGPNSKRTPEAQFYIALINEEMGELETAASAYETALRRYRSSSLAPEASFRRAQCLYHMADKTPRSEEGYRDALSALAMHIRDYPNDRNRETAQKYLDELKEKLADIYYNIAVFYDKITRKPQAAVIAYNDFIRNFPTSDRTEEATKRVDQLEMEMEKK